MKTFIMRSILPAIMLAMATAFTTSQAFALANPTVALVKIIGGAGLTKSAGYGGGVTFNRAEARDVVGGKYMFSFDADVVNSGGVGTGVFVNNVTLDGGPVPFTPPNMNLAPAVHSHMLGNLYLTPGVHTLRFYLDTGAAVAEGPGEANNLCVITITVV